MKIKNIKTELVDEQTRFVLKRITTDSGEFFNRDLAISNFIYNCEKRRLLYNKSLFKSPFQTFHLRYDKRVGEWDFLELETSKKHALKQNRFFIPYKQRNESQLSKLTWNEAEKDFQEFLDKFKIENIPYPIHKNATLKEWKKRKKDALSVMNPSQNLIPVFFSKHNVKSFPYLIKNEIEDGNLLGVTSSRISNLIEKTNLSILRAINCKTKVGEKCSLIFNFDYPRILTNHSNIAGCFAHSCFGGDIFSEKSSFIRSMSKKAIQKMMKKTPEEFYFYDPKQKGFNKSKPQKEWYGFDLTRTSMKNVSVNEGLDGYHAIWWINNLLQQRDLKLINNLLLLKKDTIKSLRDFSRWGVFWDTTISPLITQTSLAKFR